MKYTGEIWHRISRVTNDATCNCKMHIGNEKTTLTSDGA